MSYKVLIPKCVKEKIARLFPNQEARLSFYKFLRDDLGTTDSSRLGLGIVAPVRCVCRHVEFEIDGRLRDITLWINNTKIPGARSLIDLAINPDSQGYLI